MTIHDNLKVKLARLVNFEICNIQFGGSLNSLVITCTYAGEEASKSIVKLNGIVALNLSYEPEFSEEIAFIAGISIDHIVTEESLLSTIDNENYLFTNYHSDDKHMLPFYVLRIDGDICINALTKEISVCSV